MDFEKWIRDTYTTETTKPGWRWPLFNPRIHHREEEMSPTESVLWEQAYQDFCGLTDGQQKRALGKYGYIPQWDR